MVLCNGGMTPDPLLVLASAAESSAADGKFASESRVTGPVSGYTAERESTERSAQWANQHNSRTYPAFRAR
jgi:hypothetical protein